MKKINRCQRYPKRIKGEWFNYHSAINKSLLWVGQRNRRNYNYCHVAEPGVNGFIVGEGWYEFGCKLEQLYERTRSKERRKRNRKLIRSLSVKSNPIYFDEFKIIKKEDN